VRNHRVHGHRLPRYANEQEHRHVGEQRRTEQLEHAGDQQERAGRQNHSDARTSDQRPHSARSRVQQVHTLSNRDKISGNVKRVRDDQNRYQHPDHGPPNPAELDRDQLAESLARGKRGTVAYLLNPDHQREGRSATHSIEKPNRAPACA
jgi:hypothetical protein